MGKYTSRQRQEQTPARNTINPYMRGIGCLFMVIVPVFSYALGNYLAGQGFGRQILPASWYVSMTFSPKITSLSGLSVIAGWLGSIPNLPATLALAVVIMVIVGGILSIVYGYMYSLLAPSKYAPYDVPPPRVKTKKYKR